MGPDRFIKITEIQMKHILAYKVMFLLFLFLFIYAACKQFWAGPISSFYVRFGMRGWLAGRMTSKQIKQVYVLLSSGHKDSTLLVFYWLTYGSKC